MPLKLITSACLCLCLSISAFGQLDSLKAVLDTEQNANKVKTLNEIFRATHNADPAGAMGYAREALNVATTVNDTKGMAAAYNNLGIAYRTQGALDKGLEYYLESLKLYESLNNKEGIATTKNNISTIYSLQKDYSQAMKYLEESYQLLTELGDDNKLIGSMNNLGNLHSEIQMFDNAMKYFNQAYQLSEKKGELYADPLINMGNVYFRQGNFQRAVYHYEKALEIDREKNNSLSVLNIMVNLGITFTKAKQPQRAQVYLNEANRMCHELRAFSFLPSIYKTQSENFATQGLWKDAYESMAAYENEREKIYSEESSRRIAQLEILMQFQEIERKHDALLKESQIDKLELRSNRLVITVIVLILLCALGGYNYFNVNRKALIKRKNVAEHAN